MILFSGIPAAGKSRLFKERFVETHLRINLDMLRTRHRESLLVNACLEAKQPFVVDNTNLTPEQRTRYIIPARAARFRVVGYRFHVALEAAIARNTGRIGRALVPEHALRSALRQWQPPDWDEGFDALFEVWSGSDGFQLAEIDHAQ
ncbi:AAA family ATPase [uncultured Thiodictyon sp.]|uniref:AAA family ATPase n=1 Tax=uncultured Thiodictyon sp. TaxID=1846217 RepID=UPI0025E35192|nr:AAA family ATPase [uncultured Thiodictyon sp.]